MQLSHFQSKSYQDPPSGANSKQKDSHFDMLKDSLELSLKVRNDEALYKYIMYILYQPTFVVTGIICLGCLYRGLPWLHDFWGEIWCFEQMFGCPCVSLLVPDTLKSLLFTRKTKHPYFKSFNNPLASLPGDYRFYRYLVWSSLDLRPIDGGSKCSWKQLRELKYSYHDSPTTKNKHDLYLYFIN